MIKVTFGTNATRTTIMVDESKGIKEFLGEQQVSLQNVNVTIDGCSLSVNDLQKTFEEYGIKESCSLYAITKADGAIRA